MIRKSHAIIFCRPVNIDGETHPAVIYCSSGTTGPATKLCVSHATLLDDAATHVKMNEFDTTLSFCLLSWMTELCFFVAGFIYGAKRIITTKQFTPELLLKLTEKYHVSLNKKLTLIKIIITKVFIIFR